MNEFTALAESQLNSPHYLKSVTQLGDTHPIVANCDIRSSSGMKLISAGVHINSSLYERLLQHKLVPPLDESFSTGDTVTSAGLAEKAIQMMQEDKRLALIKSTESDGQTLPGIMKQVPLNPAVAFKLTIMRETNAEMYKRSIYVALVSTYIGMQLQMNKHQLVDLATAALLRDIGMLHVDPKLLEPGYKMTELEKRHLYVHSVTGAMLLKPYPEYKQKVLDAILQHHERQDGSGYPRGLMSGGIGQFGKIVAVSEIVASRYNNNEIQYGGAKLGTILKLNLRRYGSELVRFLKVFYQEEEVVSPCSEIDIQSAHEKLLKIISTFSAWKKMQVEFDNKDRLFAFIDERMMNLKMEIVDAGLNTDAEDYALLEIKNDSRACFDARILLDETVWQLRNILRECRRRWPEVDARNLRKGAEELNLWIKEVEAL